jgi:hypothetical protein
VKMGENFFDMFILCSFSKSNATHVIMRHSLQSKRKNILIDVFDIHWTIFLFKATFNISEARLCLHPQIKNLLNWAQSIELIPTSRHQNQYKATSVGVMTNISK